MGQRLLHPNSYEPDGNLEKLELIFAKYGDNAVIADSISYEAAMTFSSNITDKSTADLLKEFDMETMHEYMERIRSIIKK